MASPTYVHDALGYFHYAMQFPRTFGLTCFVGTITLWIIDACMLLMGMLNQLQTEQMALSLKPIRIEQYPQSSLKIPKKVTIYPKLLGIQSLKLTIIGPI